MAEIHIEPWGPDDFELVEQLMGDPEMTRFLGGPESPEKLRDRQERYAKPGSGMYKIVDDASGAGIGSVGYWHREWRKQQVYETGWSVIPAFQGQGIAVAAMRELIDLVAASSDPRPLHAYPKVENAASNALCRKLGFELLGEEDFEYPPGNPILCNNWRYEIVSVAQRPGPA